MKSKFLMLAIAAMMMGGVDAAQRCADLEDFGVACQYITEGNNVIRLLKGIENLGGVLSIRTGQIDDFVNYGEEILDQNDINNVRAIRVFGHISKVDKFIECHNFAPNTPITYVGADGLPYRTTVMDVRNNLRILP